MTGRNLYNISMNTLLLSALTLSLLKGITFILLLFFVCFFLTHFTKLALLGWKTKQHDKQSKPQEKAPEVTPPEPDYYIVERKKSRAKAQYSPPKEIRFK